MDTIHTRNYPSPLGELLLGDWQGALVLCDWRIASNGYHSDSRVPQLLNATLQEQATPLLAETVAQLNAYFTGHRRDFDLPVRLVGTPFQERVWQALRAIPCGQTCSYQNIADAIGNPKATRAVAGAISRNPASVIVPCHRVIGKNGGLTGYNGGTDALYIKERLLALEQGMRELAL